MRPTLHLTNFASRSQHGPGSLWAAMASAPAHVRAHSRGVVPCHVDYAHVQRVREGLEGPDPVGTARRYYGLSRTYAIAMRMDNMLSPFLLEAHCWPVGSGWTETYVRDGDTLVCTCARPDTGRRPENQPFCHLEVWAPELVRAGWDVVLYGRRLTDLAGAVCWADSEDDYTGLWVPGEAA